MDALERAGVEVVFGIPSVHNLPIYDALGRRGTIRAVTVRHEQTAAGAADGYARVSGRLGVLVTSTGPGAANAMGGLLEARVSGSPVLHLTGQIETRYLGLNRGFIHEVPDQASMLGSVSKQVVRVERAEEVASSVAGAIAAATTAPQGPVSVEIPIDLQYAETAQDGWPPPVGGEGRAEREAAPAAWAEAAERIGAARRPVIWAGGGAVRAGAEKEVAALARRIGAGVLTTPNARGVLPEDDPLSIGNLSWDEEVRELLGEADVLIGVGTRYQGPNTENWRMTLPSTVVQIDVDPSVPARSYPATVEARGDAKEVLAFVLGQLEQEPHEENSSWREQVASVASRARTRLRAVIGPQSELLDALAGLLDEHTVVVKDSTIPAYTWGNRLLPVRRSRTAIMPNGFAIGLGLAHSLGAAVANRPSPVICMVGDGGFMLTATELATIAQQQLPVVVIVFDDGGYGILRNIQDKQYGRRIGVDLGRPDFCGLARALGVEAERVSTAAGFGAAVKAALGASRPFLVAVDVDAIGPMGKPYTGTSRPPSTPDR